MTILSLKTFLTTALHDRLGDRLEAVAIVLKINNALILKAVHVLIEILENIFKKKGSFVK